MINFRVQYFTKEDRENYIKEYSNLNLLLEENIIDGNFLTFTDQPFPPIKEVL